METYLCVVSDCVGENWRVLHLLNLSMSNYCTWEKNSRRRHWWTNNCPLSKSNYMFILSDMISGLFPSHVLQMFSSRLLSVCSGCPVWANCTFKRFCSNRQERCSPTQISDKRTNWVFHTEIFPFLPLRSQSQWSICPVFLLTPLSLRRVQVIMVWVKYDAFRCSAHFLTDSRGFFFNNKNKLHSSSYSTVLIRSDQKLICSSSLISSVEIHTMFGGEQEVTEATLWNADLQNNRQEVPPTAQVSFF